MEIEIMLIFLSWFCINLVSCAERNRLLTAILDELKREEISSSSSEAAAPPNPIEKMG